MCTHVHTYVCTYISLVLLPLISRPDLLGIPRIVGLKSLGSSHDRLESKVVDILFSNLNYRTFTESGRPV